MTILYSRVIGGLYYKHTTIVNYAFSIVNKLEALLTDNARVAIYDHHGFITVQATDQIDASNCGITFTIVIDDSS